MEDTIKNPKIIIDNSLEKYRGMVLFPEKLAKANKMLENSNVLELISKYDKKSLSK
jgi:hypothetical protein